VLTGAGISAESGIPTFRDANGLWEGHDVMEVASPEGWAKNPKLVLEFYNQRRKAAAKALPNKGHQVIAQLERYFDVTVITQNIDELHEKAGSTHIIHLHGEIKKARSTADESLVYDIGARDIQWGDCCEKGSQLRPHIVWFGEMVPMIEVAAEYCFTADLFLVVGTSLVVYPAAGLLNYVPKNAPKFVVDPHLPELSYYQNVKAYAENASTGMPKVMDELLKALQ
jgi:NAD-dependent deacetylase